MRLDAITLDVIFGMRLGISLFRKTPDGFSLYNVTSTNSHMTNCPGFCPLFITKGFHSLLTHHSVELEGRSNRSIRRATGLGTCQCWLEEPAHLSARNDKDRENFEPRPSMLLFPIQQTMLPMSYFFECILREPESAAERHILR